MSTHHVDLEPFYSLLSQESFIASLGIWGTDCIPQRVNLSWLRAQLYLWWLCSFGIFRSALYAACTKPIDPGETVQPLKDSLLVVVTLTRWFYFSFLALQHAACHDWPNAHGVSHGFNHSVVLPCSCNNEHFALRLPPALPTITWIPRLPSPQVRPSFPFSSFLCPVTACRQSSFLRAKWFSSFTYKQRNLSSSHNSRSECCQVLEQLNRALVSKPSCLPAQLPSTSLTSTLHQLTWRAYLKHKHSSWVQVFQVS